LKNKGFFQRPKIMERCQDKYAQEIEITSLVNKIRDAHSMISGLQTKEQKQLLKYTKDRIIDLEEKSSSEDWTDSTSEEEINDGDLTKVKKDKYCQKIDHAIGYSIIKSIGLEASVKKDLLKRYQKSNRIALENKL
jgi:hypothetical protein